MLGWCFLLTSAVCSGPATGTARAPRFITGKDGSPWLVMTLPDGDQEPANRISEMLAAVGAADPVANAASRNAALSSYMNSAVSLPRSAAGVGVDV